MFSGGPAIAHIKLYEIDPEKNAPVIQRPKDLPIVSSRSTGSGSRRRIPATSSAMPS